MADAKEPPKSMTPGRAQELQARYVEKRRLHREALGLAQTGQQRTE